MNIGTAVIQAQLDVTPTWWPRRSRDKQSEGLCARALMRVHELPLLTAFQITATSVVALVRPTDEIRIEALEQKRRALVEELDRMEHQAEAAGELRKPTERLLLETVLLQGITKALLVGDAGDAVKRLHELNQLRSTRGPVTFDVGYPYRHRDKIKVPCDNEHKLEGSFQQDCGVVITGFEAKVTGDPASIDVTLLRGMTIVHETTLDRLLASKHMPPIWITPRQNYGVWLRNTGAPTLELEKFRMHGYAVECDAQRDCR